MDKYPRATTTQATDRTDQELQQMPNHTVTITGHGDTEAAVIQTLTAELARYLNTDHDTAAAHLDQHGTITATPGDRRMDGTIETYTAEAVVEIPRRTHRRPTYLR